jgi:hypothetical protein
MWVTVGGYLENAKTITFSISSSSTAFTMRLKPGRNASVPE